MVDKLVMRSQMYHISLERGSNCVSQVGRPVFLSACVFKGTKMIAKPFEFT